MPSLLSLLGGIALFGVNHGQLTPQAPPPQNPQGAPPPLPGAIPAVTAIPLQCDVSLTEMFNGPKLTLSLSLPYMADVNVYIYSEELELQQLTGYSTSTGTARVAMATSPIYSYMAGTPPSIIHQGHLPLPNLAMADTVELEVGGTGNGPFWILAQCTKVTTTAPPTKPPTNPPPTPPPTPLPATKLTLGTMECGTAIIGQYGATPSNTGTISLQIRQPNVGSVALYINGLMVNKLKAFLVPNPLGPPVTHPLNVPIAETSIPGTGYLYLPDVLPGSDIIFHIDLDGQGEYFAITQCLTPAPTMAPVTLPPTTRVPTPEFTTSGVGNPGQFV